MKINKLVDAIGMIDERKILNAKRESKVKKRSFKRAIVLAAVVLCFTLSFTVLAATTNPFYIMLYNISPTVAQVIKPVNLSCTDNGIKMEVLSAAIYENEAAIYVSLQDLTDENRIDGTTDLFDSYRINRSFDSSASCNRVSFDEESKTAIFLITVSQWNNKKIGGDKITFYFTQFLSNKNIFEGELTNLDLKSVGKAEKTQNPTDFCGGGGKDFDYESLPYLDYLVPIEGGVLSPVDGVEITNIGFIDNKLHIQLYFDKNLMYDNHGYIDMLDSAGNRAENFCASFWNDDKTGAYSEFIYDITPEEISNYRARGNLVTCKSLHKGNWQVTFPLENRTFNK